MQIRIPKHLWAACCAVGDWLNVPLYAWRDYELLRIDIITVLFGIAIAVWYLQYGLWAALGATLGYVAVLTLSLMLR
jgi:hypothetical protein